MDLNIFCAALAIGPARASSYDQLGLFQRMGVREDCQGGFRGNPEGTVLPAVLVDELLRLHGICVKHAESVFSSGDGDFHPIQAPVRDTRW